MNRSSISGLLVDVHQRLIRPSQIIIEDDKIADIIDLDPSQVPAVYILPGFIDAHIHIESSMLPPFEFARIACTHGTIATISDPHEIANVNGMEGVRYMIQQSKGGPVKIHFGAPSCVPATTFETAGAELDAHDVDTLIRDPDIWYLSEVMNYPGVLHGDPELMAKIQAAKNVNKPVDGHAPGLKGDLARQYASHGITTDHECFTLDEALDKIAAGMYVIIREGSAARNYEALAPLLKSHPDKVMFCSDDKHPDELVLGHINLLVQRAVAEGYDLYDVLWAASVLPVLHYKIPVGLLRKGDYADFIVVKDLKDFEVEATFQNGQKVAENGQCLISYHQASTINHFYAMHREVEDFRYEAKPETAKIRVIEVLDGQLITQTYISHATIENGNLVSNVENDVLKIVVVNRYTEKAPVSVGFIKNFGLKSGAIASTVAHDSHNIIAVGTSDEEICRVVNLLIDAKGGVAVIDASKNISNVLPLEIGGLMSADPAERVAELYSEIDRQAKELGCTLKAPFMSLSFMALLVIPSLKLSDKGLFDGNKFEMTSLETV